MRTTIRSYSAATVLAACLAAPAAAQTQLWIRQFGSIYQDYAYALCRDGSGGAFVAGQTNGSLGGPSAGGMDAWLARYDSAGNQTWIRQFGTVFADGARALCPSDAGGAFVAGFTSGSLGGPNASPTIEDTWLARYDSAGNQTWIRQLGTTNFDAAYALCPDGAGGAFVGGRTGGTLGGPLAGYTDVWLARYDSAGNQTWIRQLGSSGHDYATALCPDGAGGAFVAGYTDNSLGGPSAGGIDAWLARYDSAGNQTWVRQFGTSGDDSAGGLCPDGAGGAFIAGGTGGSLGGPSAGGIDAWLARYDSAGNQTWVRQFGTSFKDHASALCPDGAGGAFAAGNTNGCLGGGPCLGDYDAWLARFGACYPDCNGDGSLTVADFGCFQSKFVAADPYADCNADGSLTVADFGCFQTKFVAGCP